MWENWKFWRSLVSLLKICIFRSCRCLSSCHWIFKCSNSKVLINQKFISLYCASGRDDGWVERGGSRRKMRVSRWRWQRGWSWGRARKMKKKKKPSVDECITKSVCIHHPTVLQHDVRSLEATCVSKPHVFSLHVLLMMWHLVCHIIT